MKPLLVSLALVACAVLAPDTRAAEPSPPLALDDSDWKAVLGAKVAVVLTSGEVVAGRVRSFSDASVSLFDLAGNPRLVPRAEIASVSVRLADWQPSDVRLQPPPSGEAASVSFESTESGFVIKADGAEQCQAPCTLKFAPGIHRVLVSSRGLQREFEVDGSLESLVISRQRRSLLAPGIVLGVGAAQVATGVGLWLDAKHQGWFGAPEAITGLVFMAAGTCAVIAAGFTLLALPREHLDLAPARASGVSLLGVGLAPVRGGATAGLALSF